MYCLNVANRRRTHICILPFDGRCSASGEGWVCVGGGEDGNFCAVQIDSFLRGTQAPYGEQFPLDLSDYVVGSRGSGRTSTSYFVERAGDEIVNSISIHRLGRKDGNSDEVLAVFTNNDKTVRVYSLTYGVEDTVVELPFPMNHATISPNGDFMVAVGDYHQAYFFYRDPTNMQQSVRHTMDGEHNVKAPRWLLMSVVQLHVPSPSLNTGYFTTAWSPSGHLCAVGSECGYITLFDTSLIATTDGGEDAILQIIPSSRPDTVAGPGAVRTMFFSPEPWDLLIWSEDQGRVGLADIRSSLQMKQIINIDTKEKLLRQKHVIDDTDDFSVALRRFYGDSEMSQNVHETLNSSNLESHNWITDHLDHLDHLDAFIQRRRVARDERGTTNDEDESIAGLTSHERQMLEGLRVSRQREEVRERRDGLHEANEAFPPLSGDSHRTSRLTMPPNPLVSVMADFSYPQMQLVRSNGSPLHPNRSSTQEYNSSRAEPLYRSRRRPSITLNDGANASFLSRGTRVSNPIRSSSYSILQNQASNTVVPATCAANHAKPLIFPSTRKSRYGTHNRSHHRPFTHLFPEPSSVTPTKR